jgi:hypothetical protein
MNADEALEFAEKGNFVTHEGFDSDQSLHYWRGKYYYNDGAIVPPDFIHKNFCETNLYEGWSVKYTPEQIDSQMLDSLHEEFGHLMIGSSGRSYEECYRKEDDK